MDKSELQKLTRDQLPERLIALRQRYDAACVAYDLVTAGEIHRDMRLVEQEIRERDGAEWRSSGLEDLNVEQLIDRFMVLAIAYDEADGMPEVDEVYWKLDAVRNELERRDGDQRRKLLKLYSHEDVRIRQAAAEATRTVFPILSKSRLLAIDEDDWVPPDSDPIVSTRQLDEIFSKRSHGKKPGRSKFAELTTDELVERFAAIAVEQDRALLYSEIAKYNRLYDQLKAVEEELKGRPNDQRRALLRLYEHPNWQVRLMAAHATLAIEPEAGRRMLETIATSRHYPQAGAAGMSLDSLDRGIYKPK